MHQCATCGEALTSAAYFCPRCGTPFAAPEKPKAPAAAQMPAPPPVPVSAPTARFGAVQEQPKSRVVRDVLIGVGVFFLLFVVILFGVARSVIKDEQARRAERIAQVEREIAIAEGPRVAPRPSESVASVGNFCGIEHYPDSVTKACRGRNCVQWESNEPASDVIGWYARYYARDEYFGHDFSDVQSWSVHYERANISISRRDQVTQIVVSCRP